VGLAGQCFILGALHPSKSGPIRQHIVEHIVKNRLIRLLPGGSIPKLRLKVSMAAQGGVDIDFDLH
jgi:hypothetical protein